MLLPIIFSAHLSATSIGLGLSANDRFGFVHETSNFEKEWFSSGHIYAGHYFSLNNDTKITGKINLGLEFHQDSKYYHDMYFTSYPSIGVSHKLLDSLDFSTNIKMGQFFTVIDKGEGDAPDIGYSPKINFFVGLKYKLEERKRDEKKFDLRRRSFKRKCVRVSGRYVQCTKSRTSTYSRTGRN